MEKLLQIQFKSSDIELLSYRSLIEENAKREIGNAITTPEEKISMLLHLFIGSRNNRQGPQPGIEQQASMIGVIRSCVQRGFPIPVLIPAGPKKTANNEGVDLAELGVLKGLKCLQKDASAIYEPGFSFLFRLEDATGYFLESKNAEASIKAYISQFNRLIEILGMGDYTKTFCETEVPGFTMKEFSEKSRANATMLYRYIIESDKVENEDFWKDLLSYQELTKTGWKGIIPREMRSYYIDKYFKLYPGKPMDEYIHHMTDYMGCTLTRRQMRMVGNENFPFGGLEIGYATPTPGLPEGMGSTRVYYRSIALNQSKRNVPFWRAKGVYKISEDNSVRTSLLVWNNIDVEIHPGELIISNENDSISIKADCVFE